LSAARPSTRTLGPTGKELFVSDPDKKDGRKPWSALAREYLAPAGLGVVIGAIGTLATAVLQFLDQSQKIIEQQRKLDLIKKDMSAYSKVIRKIYPLLPKDQLSDLFNEKGKTLIEINHGSPNDGTWMHAQLKISEEGVYYVWCESGMDSNLSGASSGKWLLREEAMAWANSNASASDFRSTFGDEGLKVTKKFKRRTMPLS
ncbi:MAG: hypothetical protein ABIU05_11485, partial [Nitrospirales bacterium]